MSDTRWAVKVIPYVFVLALVCFFFVWPGVFRYSYYHRSGTLVRIDRLTGRVTTQDDGSDNSARFTHDSLDPEIGKLVQNTKKSGHEAAQALRNSGATEDQVDAYMNTYYWGKNGRPAPHAKDSLKK
jgi:hypothetical protein